MFDKYAIIRNSKGLTLLIVIVAIILTCFLAAAVIIVMQNNSRLAFHKVSRIRAHYAAYGAEVYAFDRLRTGAWGQGQYAICPSSADCSAVPVVPPSNQVIDADYPFRVDIDIGPILTSGNFIGTRQVRVRTAWNTTAYW